MFLILVTAKQKSEWHQTTLILICTCKKKLCLSQEISWKMTSSSPKLLKLSKVSTSKFHCSNLFSKKSGGSTGLKFPKINPTGPRPNDHQSSWDPKTHHSSENSISTLEPHLRVQEIFQQRRSWWMVGSPRDLEEELGNDNGFGYHNLLKRMDANNKKDWNVLDWDILSYCIFKKMKP